MKIVVLNGSPREKGNTKYALEILRSSISKHSKDTDITFIDVAKKKIAGCVGCDYCSEHDSVCIFNDDGQDIVECIASADTIIFGTPVYWWGVSAQLKLVIDRMQAVSAKLKGSKKIGLIAVGADGVENRQYDLITGQFECISEYLEWELLFSKAYSAFAIGDLEKNTDSVQELSELWKQLV